MDPGCERDRPTAIHRSTSAGDGCVDTLRLLRSTSLLVDGRGSPRPPVSRASAGDCQAGSSGDAAGRFEPGGRGSCSPRHRAVRTTRDLHGPQPNASVEGLCSPRHAKLGRDDHRPTHSVMVGPARSCRPDTTRLLRIELGALQGIEGQISKGMGRSRITILREDAEEGVQGSTGNVVSAGRPGLAAVGSTPGSTFRMGGQRSSLRARDMPFRDRRRLGVQSGCSAPSSGVTFGSGSWFEHGLPPFKRPSH